METTEVQFVDLEVTQQKFEEELKTFTRLKDEYRRKGVLLLEQYYPNLYFAFVASALNPMPIAFAVCINFVNYDVRPLSVKFVHPLTLEPVKIEQVATRLPRKLEGSPIPQALLQAEMDNEPFFCIPGVREYHEHPFHNGDSWFLYRKRSGEGTLCFLLDNLHLYGTSYLCAYTAQINFNVQTNFLQLGYNSQHLPV